MITVTQRAACGALLFIKMTYSLIIPPEFLGELVELREKTGKSIRSMILEAVRKYIEKMKSRVIVTGSRSN